MKNKKSGHFRIYIVILFIAFMLLRGVFDFLLGFYAGLVGMDYSQGQKLIDEFSGEKIIFEILIILLFSNWFYKIINKKIAKPVEQLAAGMRKVSQGDLDVRVPVDGKFEFGQMQETFNYMVQELEETKKHRERQAAKNQQLYSGIAHDLKTPMTMILGYAKLLEQDMEKEEQLKCVNTIVEQTKQANDLLDAMLSYSKLENPDYVLNCETKDLAECLRACVADCYASFEKADMDLELSIPEERVEYFFDEVQMKRVFLNLLTNTIKHNLAKTKCVISLEQKEKIQIVVADNGPKISKELQDKLFDPFAVGEVSRNTKNGSGLGLSISKRIIERHNGSIHYEDVWCEKYKAFVIEL